MPKPTSFDWLTVAAIVLGPILALVAQRALDLLREKKSKRLQIYLTLMGLRATPLHPEHVRALNSIDVVFSKRSDARIREAWAKVLAHLATDENTAGWNDRLVDLKTDLYQAIGVAVGYNLSVDYIKTQIYAPKYHFNAEIDQIKIREGLAKALTNDGLKVVLSEPEGIIAPAPKTEPVVPGSRRR